MKIKKEKKPCALARAIISMLQGVFLHIVGSWGAFVMDKSGNIIDKKHGKVM